MSRLAASEARARFAAARVAVLATVGAGQGPHLVPIAFAVARDTVYSAVDDKPKRTRELRRLDNVAQDPRAALLVEHYEEDWTALWWVRADGRGRVVAEDGEEAQTARALLAERYPQQTGAGAVLAVDVERWSGWAASRPR